MQCLSCGADMMRNQVSTTAGLVAYDLCEQCGSLWLDHGEMDKAVFRVAGSVEASTQEPIADPQPRHWKCPRCDNADLIAVRFLDCTDLILHHCRSCGGYWLDGGELDAMDQELAADGPVHGNGIAGFVRNVHQPFFNKRIKAESPQPDTEKVEALPIAGAIKMGQTNAACPACGKGLWDYQAFGMRFQGCPACKGVWLIRDELRELKNKCQDPGLRWLNDEVNNLEKAAAMESKRLCPQCPAERLVTARFGKSAVMIDWCRKCGGTWLDRDEFDAIKDYLKREWEGMRPGQIGRIALRDAEQAVTGGPESHMEEARDAEAAAAAMISASICEHPSFVKWFWNARSSSTL